MTGTVSPDATFKRADTRNREAWLQRAVEELRPVFEREGWPFESVRVSVGWGYRRSDALGQCWARKRSRDGSNQIFLIPTVDDPLAALETLAHELAHAADDCRHGHRKPFPAICEAVGLRYESARATPWSDEGRRFAEGIVAKLGPFPHPRIDVAGKTGKQGTRQLKASCPACGYTVRVTAKWLEEAGAPLCPCSAGPIQPERGDLEVAPPPTPEALVQAAIKRLTAEGRADLADELDGALWAHEQKDHGWRPRPPAEPEA